MISSNFLKYSFLGALLVLTGCENHSSNKKEGCSVIAKPVIATITPTLGTFSSRTTVSAAVQPSPKGVVFISSPTTGTIESININVGTIVSPHTILATIKSSEVSDNVATKIQAQASLEQSKRVYEMNAQLLKIGAITHNELLTSLTAYKQAQALLKGYDQKLSYMGASSGQSLTLRSPIQGVVYDISTHLGEKVTNDPQQVLMKIADPKSKLIVATVYEKDLSAFKVGEKVTISIPRMDDMQGVISYVNDVVDPINKTVSVTIRPTSATTNLKLNMFVKVSVDAMYQNVYRLSKKAILFKEGKFIVFVKQGNSFTPQPITVLNDDTSTDFSLIEGIKPNSIIAAEAIAMERQ